MLHKKYILNNLRRNFPLPFLVIYFLFFSIQTDGQTKENPATSTTTKDSISLNQVSSQANNPAAAITMIQFRNILLPNVSGTDGPTNSLGLQPVLPIGPFHKFNVAQLVKVTLAFNTIPSPNKQHGISDLQIFDLFTFKKKWGVWGVGPSLIFPTASAALLGAGKWQAGPSAAIIYSSAKNLIAGLVFQNPISYAGDKNRPNQNNLIIAPTLTYSLSKGWFGGLADFNVTFDWENGGVATIPIGLQVGKVINLGKETFSVSVEAGGFAASPDNSPKPGMIFGFELNQIFNFHVGPGEKIHLHGKKKYQRIKK